MPGHTSARVVLLETTGNPLSVIYTACRQCYSDSFAGDSMSGDITDYDKKEKFVNRVISSGHESPIEHVKFTFAVEGVSRSLTHQLVRHRMASYSQQSQRYVKGEDFSYIVPPSIQEKPEALEHFEAAMENIRGVYAHISDILEEAGMEGEDVYQDARFVLPQAAETKIVITMNCRELLHFFKLRCCMRAQWEIRHLAEEMLAICHEKLPAVFPEKAAKCDFLGYCPEGSFSCRRYPPKK